MFVDKMCIAPLVVGEGTFSAEWTALWSEADLSKSSDFQGHESDPIPIRQVNVTRWCQNFFYSIKKNTNIQFEFIVCYK